MCAAVVGRLCVCVCVAAQRLEKVCSPLHTALDRIELKSFTLVPDVHIQINCC